MKDEKILRFIDLYTRKYSQSPYYALVECGLLDLGYQDPKTVLRKVMTHPLVKKAMREEQSQEKEQDNTILSSEDRQLLLSRVIRDAGSYVPDAKGVRIKDPKTMITAIAELNKIEGVYAPNKIDLTSTDRTMSPRAFSEKEMKQYHALFDREY